MDEEINQMLLADDRPQGAVIDDGDLLPEDRRADTGGQHAPGPPLRRVDSGYLVGARGPGGGGENVAFAPKRGLSADELAKAHARAVGGSGTGGAAGSADAPHATTKTPHVGEETVMAGEGLGSWDLGGASLGYVRGAAGPARPSARARARYLYAVGGAEGQVFPEGDADYGGYVAASTGAWVYEVANMEWKQLAPMTSMRSMGAACAFDGRCLVAGGFDNDHVTTSSVECHDPHRDVWEPVGRLVIARDSFALVVAEEQLLALGGWDHTHTHTHTHSQHIYICIYIYMYVYIYI